MNGFSGGPARCPRCNGVGFKLVRALAKPGGCPNYQPEPGPHWIRCARCRGSGWTVIDRNPTGSRL